MRRIIETENYFIECLQKAIETKGIEHKCIATDLDGSGAHEIVMTEGKQGTKGSYQVRWHNRWCFYYDGEMIASYFNGDDIHGETDYVRRGNSIAKNYSEVLYPLVIEAVRKVLNVNNLCDRILIKSR
jgi:hypothetical protein